MSSPIILGDDWHRARTIEEMELAASLHPCPQCRATPEHLVLATERGPERDRRTLQGLCRSCGAPLVFEIRVEGDPATSRPARFEVGDARQATILEPRALTSELERLRAAGIDDDETRERALTCIVELLKFPLIRDGERGGPLVELRDRLLAEERPTKPPSIASIARAIFSANRRPKTIAEVAAALGVQLALDASALASTSTKHLDLTLSGSPVTALSFDYVWSALHDGPLRTTEQLVARFAASWTATFASGVVEMERVLAKRFGRARALPSHHVYDETFLFATRGDEHRLSFYAELPDWAAPPVDPIVRDRALRSVAEIARTARDAEPLEQLVASLPNGCGLRPRAAVAPGDVELDLVPPLPAIDVMRLFDLDGLAAFIPGRSSFQHGAVPLPGIPPTDRYLGRGEAYPTLGRFKVLMRLEASDVIRGIRFAR